MADLAKDVGETAEGAVVRGAFRGEGDGFPLRVFLYELGVFVLGVVFEVGVEAIGRRGADDVEQPREVVVRKGDELGERRSRGGDLTTVQQSLSVGLGSVSQGPAEPGKQDHRQRGERASE